MSSTLLNKAGKALFEKHLEQYAPQDPMYEEYTDAKGKKKKRRRVLPPGLSARDAKILKSVQRRAHYLDKGFMICGMRFGWTFIIGLIPVAGDVCDAGLNYLLVVRKARQAQIPEWLLRRMLLNNAVSIAAGFIPIAGDVVLAAYKANSRNATLLEEFLRIRGDVFLKAEEDKKKGGKKIIEASSSKDKKIEEEIKPGAGVDTKSGQERVDVVEGTMPPEVAPQKKNSILSWRPSISSKSTKDKVETLPASTDVKDKDKVAPVAEADEEEAENSGKGKFVEQINSTGSIGKSGTLKKSNSVKRST